MKAMILAAGLGNRMRPLTYDTPKPLLLVKGQPLIVHTILALRRSGYHHIVINVHHHAQRIMDYLGDGTEYGVKLIYSVEQELLGTGGGIKRALPLLGEQPFLVVSADIFTDFSFAKLSSADYVNDKLAHLLMVDNPEFHLQGDFALEQGILSMTGERKLTYANIGIIHPGLFAPNLIASAMSDVTVAMLAKSAEVSDASAISKVTTDIFPLDILLKEAIRMGKVSGEHYVGIWYNVGTPKILAEIA